MDEPEAVLLGQLAPIHFEGVAEETVGQRTVPLVEALQYLSEYIYCRNIDVRLNSPGLRTGQSPVHQPVFCRCRWLR